MEEGPVLTEHKFRVTPLSEAKPFDLNLHRVASPDKELIRKKQCDLWAFVWTATAVAADLMGAFASSFPGLRVLELGCGSGIASLSACLSGASCTCTDLVMDALRLLEKNAKANGCEVGWLSSESLSPEREGKTAAVSSVANRLTLSTLNFDNKDQVAGVLSAIGGVDVVLGADILFASFTIRPVLSALQAALSGPGKYGVIVDPGRTMREDFESRVDEYGLSVLRRVDLRGVRTEVATMKELTVFLLARDDSEEASEFVSTFDSAMTLLGQRCTATATKFGYTL